jgi:hypothetical protein
MLTEERIPNSFRAQVRYRHRFYQLPPKSSAKVTYARIAGIDREQAELEL